MKTRILTAVDPLTGVTYTRRTARDYVSCLVTDHGAHSWFGRPELAARGLAKALQSWPDARLAPVVS